MEKDDLKNIICRVLLALVAACIICSFVAPDLLAFYATGASLASLGVFIIELTR